MTFSPSASRPAAGHSQRQPSAPRPRRLAQAIATAFSLCILAGLPLPTLAAVKVCPGNISGSVHISNFQANSGACQVLANAALTIDATGTLLNTGSLTNNAGGTLSNAGQLTNTYLIYNFGGMSNSGTLSNSYALYNYSTLSNSGTLTNGPIGFLYNAASAQLNNSKTLTNNGYAWNGGTLTNSGTLGNNGQMYVFDSGKLANTGTLNNSGTLGNYGSVTNSGSLNNNSGAQLNNYQNGSLSNSGTLKNNSGGLLANSGSFSNLAGATLNNSGSLINDSNGTLTNKGSLVNTGSISNSGLFQVAASGTVSGSGSFKQMAGVTQVDGQLTQGLIDIAGGVLKGTGKLSSANTIKIESAATVAPGDSPGTLTLAGNVDFAGTLSIEVASASSFSQLVVQGALNFLPGARVGLALDFSPGAALYNFHIVDATSITGWSASMFDGSSVAGYHGSLSCSASGCDITLAQAVPEPGTWAMWLAGLGLLGTTMMRRHRPPERLDG